MKFSAYVVELTATWPGAFEVGQVACIGDEVYVEPKGAICVSLALDSTGTELIGRTHRLNYDEWTSFKEIK